MRKHKEWDEDAQGLLNVSNQNMLENIPNNDEIVKNINEYCFHRNAFLLIIFMQLFYDLYFNWNTYYFRHLELVELQGFYHGIPIEHIKIVFWCILGMEVFFMFLYYLFAFLCVVKKNIKLIDLFNLLCLIGLLSQIFQAYIQRFNFVTFFARIMAFIYSKFLCDVLIRLIFNIVYN